MTVRFSVENRPNTATNPSNATAGSFSMKMACMSVNAPRVTSWSNSSSKRPPFEPN